MKITEVAPYLVTPIRVEIAPTAFVAKYADPDIDTEPQAARPRFIIHGDIDYQTGQLLGPADLVRVSDEGMVEEQLPHDHEAQPVVNAIAQAIIDTFRIEAS